MVYCSKCGKKNDDDADFCKQCGTVLRKDDDEDYKKFYRSGKNRILGGICGGLGEYFKIDPLIIRILFIVGLFVSFGSFTLLYLILWIIIPYHPKYA